MGRLRILHAPRNIAGQGSDIVAALRRLGQDAQLWEDVPDVFGRASDREVALDPHDGRPTLELLLEVADRFDIVHFHFGRTFVPRPGALPPYWDLPALRSMGVRLFFTFHGTDMRIERIHRQLNPQGHVFVPPGGQPEDDRIEKSLQTMRTYAERLFVVSPNGLAYVPDAEVLPRVIDLAQWPELAPRARRVPVIVHAPTRRGTKGTDLILPALDALRAEGFEFELRLLEGISHEAVRQALSDADILIDNVVAGSYGIVSLEAMASSAVAVANMTPGVLHAHPGVPVVQADPDTLAQVLRELIPDVEQRRRIAERGRPFVAAVHDADVVARRLLEHYRAPLPARPAHVMPDWLSMDSARRIEALDRRVAALEVKLAAAQRREAELQVMLGGGAAARVVRLRRLGRSLLPMRIRRAWGREGR